MTILCHRAGELDTESLSSVRLSFRSAEKLEFQQSFQAEQDADFQPGSAAFLWRDQSLFVFAELRDVDIFNPETGFNREFYREGDVFEVFIKPCSQASYYEFHVGPSNQQFQLRLPAIGKIRSAEAATEFPSWLLVEPMLNSKVWIEQGVWCVYLEVPLAKIMEEKSPEKGDCFLVNFARYDYTQGSDNIIYSATANLSKLDYHCVEDYHKFRLA